jgi:hypothetical protein
MTPIWTCHSCGWRQPDDRPRICGRYGEPCPGIPLTNPNPSPASDGDQDE